MYFSLKRFIVALVLSFSVSTPAWANFNSNIIISSGGNNYQIVFLSANTFDANSGILTDLNRTPWYGNLILAQSFLSEMTNGVNFPKFPTGVNQAWLPTTNTGASLLYGTSGSSTVGAWPTNAAIPAM